MTEVVTAAMAACELAAAQQQRQTAAWHMMLADFVGFAPHAACVYEKGIRAKAGTRIAARRAEHGGRTELRLETCLSCARSILLNLSRRHSCVAAGVPHS